MFRIKYGRDDSRRGDAITRDEVIEYLRGLSHKDYEKLTKITNVYREADESVRVILAGSKKAAREQERELDDSSVDDIEEMEQQLLDEG